MGGAQGFGLEALSSLMAVRSTQGSEATLMHYCAEQLGSLGTRTGEPLSAAALRLELKRVPEAAMIEVSELRREAERVQKDVQALTNALKVASEEAATTLAAEKATAAEAAGGAQADGAVEAAGEVTAEERAAQLAEWLAEPPPEDLWDESALCAFFARTHHRHLQTEGLATAEPCRC
jgi:hypothetical protein